MELHVRVLLLSLIVVCSIVQSFEIQARSKVEQTNQVLRKHIITLTVTMPPLTREQRAEANMARLRARIEQTIDSGERAQPFSSTIGRFLQVGTRRVKLQNKDGTLTDSGRHYHAYLNEAPPLMYSYDQPVQNNAVVGYNGKRIMVRLRGETGSGK